MASTALVKTESRLTGDEIKAKRLEENLEKSSNWPPAPPETEKYARQEVAQSLAMTFSDDPNWKMYRPTLKGGPQYQESK
mmetsp:Transcript_31256/g.82179  ORF Transcript_31256/g.82179 Transcript_31256/m.82179 type:complete len:80 (-) Transcript_31256:171-410(-)|eukprot:CAMPEP_0115266278 /NCGR_PEP_ID=MMETSP0270-20121206/51385_1 /TAXON_ID=71861 /ORGANISM="Scrippsiella trochoidea, Strain CCMP3099" /LENGTH=79 /DNA_ID=CAMNT_0002682369 /DNA_START=84 /DNA_END=323 /DNA_ORIENTATION=+